MKYSTKIPAMYVYTFLSLKQNYIVYAYFDKKTKILTGFLLRPGKVGN